MWQISLNSFISPKQNAFIVFLSSDEFLPSFTTSVPSILFFRDFGLLKITNENGDSFGEYCGDLNGNSVLVNGSLVVLSFRRGFYVSSGRFRLLFIPVNGKYNNKIEL